MPVFCLFKDYSLASMETLRRSTDQECPSRSWASEKVGRLVRRAHRPTTCEIFLILTTDEKTAASCAFAGFPKFFFVNAPRALTVSDFDTWIRTSFAC